MPRLRAPKPEPPARRPSGDLPRPFAFPWGKGQIIEEARISTRHHQPALQLLRYDDGALSVRFCYFDLRGRFQRSPLLMSADTLEKMGLALRESPRLLKLLQRLVR